MNQEVLLRFLYGLKTIQQMGGRYAIITATFPPVLKDFMEQYGLADHCLFADFTEDPDILIRHKVSIQYSEMYLEEIAKQGKTKKVLVICNTVSRAQEVYEKLRERNDSVWLLHSRFIRRDRNLLEQKIMEFSESDEAGIWVTTQIVEASLDIDFDILHTEMCTADSLLQRMEDVTGREEGFLNFPIFLYMITKMEAEVFTRRTCISDRWKN